MQQEVEGLEAGVDWALNVAQQPLEDQGFFQQRWSVTVTSSKTEDWLQLVCCTYLLLWSRIFSMYTEVEVLESVSGWTESIT